LRYACCSAEIGWLFNGVAQVALRWYITSEAASSATTGPICTPHEPVPTTATRLPRKSTGSSGQRTGWYDSPAKSSRPGTSGYCGTDSTPVVVIRYRERIWNPSCVPVVQEALLSSHRAEVTLLFSRMWRRRSNRSTTWLRYRSVSGCGANSSDQSHSCHSSSENR
jgi:hypothetical protein